MTETIEQQKQALLAQLAKLDEQAKAEEKTENPEPKPISWRDTMGNKYRQKLHPAMLTEDGYVERRNVVPLGTKRQEFESAREWVDVQYGVDYVTSKIIIEVLKPLRINTRERFDEISELVWEEYSKCLNLTT